MVSVSTVPILAFEAADAAKPPTARSVLLAKQGALFSAICQHTVDGALALEVQAAVEQRRIAQTAEVYRLLGLIETDPARAVELARVAQIHHGRGTEFVAIEAEHRGTALEAFREVVAIAHLGVRRIERAEGRRR